MQILMATYNGEAHLQPQLTSFADQSFTGWSLRCGDDGSSDATLECLEAFARQHPSREITVQPGPGRGSAANFLSLLAQATADAPDSAMAFSDQDDVWLPEKLERAMAWLSEAGMGQGRGQEAPLAWVCRTTLTDANLVPQTTSRRFPRPPSFGNALVQNILAGNTIVLSPAAARAVATTVPAALAAGVPYHDWWIYQVVTGIGGQIHMEQEPLVLYRQHETNHLGHHGPVRGRLKRLRMIMGKTYSSWIDANLTALSHHRDMLTPQARAQLKGLTQVRAKGGAALAMALPRLGVHRQTAKGDRILRAMALAGRL